MDAPRLPVFQTFIDQLRDIWAHESDTQTRMEKAMPFLSDLLKDEDLPGVIHYLKITPNLG